MTSFEENDNLAKALNNISLRKKANMNEANTVGLQPVFSQPTAPRAIPVALDEKAFYAQFNNANDEPVDRFYNQFKNLPPPRRIRRKNRKTRKTRKSRR